MIARVEDGNIDGRGRLLTKIDLKPGMTVRVPGDADRPTFVGTLERVWTRAYRVDGVTYRIDEHGCPTVPARENGLPTHFAPSYRAGDLLKERFHRIVKAEGPAGGTRTVVMSNGEEEYNACLSPSAFDVQKAREALHDAIGPKMWKRVSGIVEDLEQASYEKGRYEQEDGR